MSKDMPEKVMEQSELKMDPILEEELRGEPNLQLQQEDLDMFDTMRRALENNSLDLGVLEKNVQDYQRIRNESDPEG